MKTLFTFLFALLLSTFLMAQSITVTHPNGGESMVGCQTYTITWTSSGVSNWYDLHYSLDGGTIWASIATNVNITNNQYSWTVPMVNSSTVKVRVMDHNAPAKRDSSDAYFTIQLPINITSPNGGEVWQGLSSHLITWTPTGTSGYFNIYYSIDNGTNWISVASNVNSNNYTWSVPNNPSTTCLVKVQDASTPCQVDLSNAVFEISPAIPVLTAPNGGEQWTINSNRSITWNTSNIALGSNVKLEWSVDNGVNYNLITSTAPNTGNYVWTIPNTPSTQCFVRISNASGAGITDASNAAFTILWPGNFITSPNGGEIWRSQNTQSITWNSTVFVSAVNIEYSVNNGASWNTIVTNYTNSGSYSWSVPQMVTTTQALVRISSYTYPANIIDTSNAVFTIKAPVTVDYPDLGPTLTGCNNINIQWSRTSNALMENYNNYDQSYGVSYCSSYELYYKVGSGAYNAITTIYNYPNQTSYSQGWTIPDVAPSSIKIKIIARQRQQTYGGAIFWIDSSDVASPVVNPSGTITVINPNGGIMLNALTNYNVTWSASGSTGSYDVLYSYDEGANYNLIVSNITSSNYNWNVNNTPGLNNVFVKVMDHNNNCRKDVSDAANTIVAATPILTSPNGGETWYVNSSRTITWTTANQYTNVCIEYSTDNGSSWNTIVASTSNSGSYAWVVPDILSAQALVKIYNVGAPTNNDISNGVFTIAYPYNFLTIPNGGEVWRSQNSQTITWNSSVFTAPVKLEYSTNAGSTWNLITASTTNNGSYSWSVPQMVSTTQALVRITNTTVPVIMDTSNAVFTIKAPVTVDYPDLGPTLTGCNSINIQWSRTSNALMENYNNYDQSYGVSYCSSYELYYKVGNGAYNAITTIYNYPNQYGYSQAWTIPDVAPSNIRIKIIARQRQQTYGGAIFWIDSSDVASPVVNPSGTITVGNPNGGVIMNALTNYNVTWSASGSTGAFDIVYSTDGGSTYPNSIANNVGGTSYTWNVNNTPSTNVYVKVMDHNNTCRKDFSNASNTIIAATPVLTAPNGGEVWKVSSTQNITWNTATLYGPVFIEFSIDHGFSWNTVVASTSNSGTYPWTVPNTVSTVAMIRISNVATPSNYDTCNAVFTINLPTPLLTSPNGAEVWRSQNTQNITWDQSTVASNVKLEYSTNNGATWNQIVASTSNTGSYSWSVPQMVTTTQALIRITNTAFPTAIDTSNAVFTIKAPVTVDYPDLGPTLTGCNSINIQWSRTSNALMENYNNYDQSYGVSYCSTYELYYKVGNSAYNAITTIYNYPNQTSYSQGWTIPDVAPSNIRIKIIARQRQQTYGGAIFWIDSSDVASPVVNPSGTITVGNPNGGVIMNALTNYNVTWSASGSTGAFDIVYSTDGGSTYPNSIANNVGGTSYTWNVNNTPSTNVYVKVMDHNNNCRKDFSNASNTIIAATPVLTAPNGGEVWKVSSTQNITWNTATLYGPVFIEFSIDHGLSWNTVVASTSNTGTYPWTVPNTVSTVAMVRISNVATPSNYDTCNAVFTINLPTPLLTSPNGGEVWRSQNNQTITWDQSTVASNVKLEYSTNNGATWNQIIASTSNTGSYSWSVPQMSTTTQALVRITNTAFPTAIDTSNAVFTIKAPVTVDYPDMGPTLTGCNSINIQWSRTSNALMENYNNYDQSYGVSYCSSYELYYKVGNGAYNAITTIYNYPNQTSYSQGWTIPDVAPSSIRIKIIARQRQQTYGGAIFWIDSSDVASPVVNPSGTITVTNPNGGVLLNALTNYNVTWTASGSTGAFDIVYSTDGGSTYPNTITSNVSGNSYTWNVNNTPSTNVYIKVMDHGNTCRKDFSNASNTIVAATPVLTSPDGAESWKVNSSQTITWNPSTLYTSVFIEYSIDNGITWNTVVSSTSNNGSYPWTVPNSITAQALVRISNVGDPGNSDVSNAVFSITYPYNFLTVPNGGEVWRSQNSQTITWNSSVFTAPVKLEYSTNAGSTWNLITSSTTNNGSYSWSVPQMVTTTQALVRITNTTVPVIMDTSNAVFTIKAPVTIDYPDLGPTLTGCSNINIQWSRTSNALMENYNNYDQSYGVSYCSTYELYYKVGNGAYNSITTIYNYPNQTSYSQAWTIPDVAPSSIRIKIIARQRQTSYGGAIFWIDSSDVASPVANPSGSITVVNPNSGVILNALTNYNITWTGSGTTGAYDIVYSVDGGANYNPVASNLGGTSYTWNVYNNPSTNVYVKVMDHSNTCRKDASDGANTIIAASPVITAPNGGEVWNVNSTHNITWNTNSVIIGGSVFIEISLDGGSTYNTVVASTSNTGSYAWTLPYAPTTQAKIRISVVGNPLLFDVSDAVFTILVPTPVVTSPNGGETWYAGESKNITWLQATYFSSTVNIEYSLDGGTTWVTIASNQTNNGTYSWTLPSLNSANVLVKVSNYTNPSVYDVSNALLTFRPWVRVITPNGGDQLGSCTQTTISFERAPTYTNFNIEYSIDNGSNWTAIQTNASYTSTFNNYTWSIPNAPTTQALIRIYPYGVLARADQSDAVFTIKRAVTIIQPNYGGVLVVGAIYPIKWQSDGISNIYDIAYSTAGPGGPWTNIVIGYNTSLNTYNWTVPNTPSTNCYLRIRDNINNCKEDISDMAFTIASTSNPITVTAPNGGDTLSACNAYNITWTESGSPIGNYNIAYSIDYGTNWVPIATNYLTISGIYNWVIPNINSPNTLVRVQSGLNPLVYDFSNALFVIKPGKLTTNNDTTICQGSSVQLHTSGGVTYSWTPTTGLSNPNISNPIATPSNTTQYIVSSTSAGCSLRDTVLITVNTNIGLNAGVTISPSTSTAICTGTLVIFTATPSNGGTVPSYQWKINGINVGANTYTYSTSSLTDGSVVSCVMTSSLQCVNNNPAASNAITMSVYPITTPSVSISTAQTTICIGTLATFTATPVNGGGSPAYQWKKNGGNVGTNSATYIDNTIVNNDVISVQMTSNANCLTTNTVNSNSIIMTVNPTMTPSVTISTPTTTVCSGTSVTFTATASNAGTSPSYQWKVNGVNAGTNSNTFTTSTLVNNNVVTCIVTSNASCNTVNPVTSNAITMTITSAPAAPTATSNSPVPFNGTLDLYASTVPGATYSWTGPNSYTSSLQTPTVPNATPALNGTYYVTANLNGCSSPAGSTVVTVLSTQTSVIISGYVKNEISQSINGAKLKLTGASADSVNTPSNGYYQFGVVQGNNYVITPSKNNDINTSNGVTTLDIVLIQRHILNVQLLNSPYKIIAADVNSSSTVTTLDVVLIKSLILQNISTFPGNKLWSFVNSDFVFANPQNPFPFEQSRSYTSAATSINQDFVGCKLGDVNNSWNPMTPKHQSPETIGFTAGSTQGKTGDLITVPVTVDHFNNISGFQYTLSWNPAVLEFVGASDGTLDMDFGEWNTTNGTLTTLWATELMNGVTLADGSVIFNLQFRITGQTGEFSPVSINSQFTSAEAVNNNLELLTFTANDGLVKVEDASGLAPAGSADFELLQNVPNPFSSSTHILFTLPATADATISMFDMYGKKVAEMKGNYHAGRNEVIWDGTDFNGQRLSDGNYYYRLQTEKYSAIRKMVLIK